MRPTFSRDQVRVLAGEMHELLTQLVDADAELRVASFDPDRHWPPGSGLGNGSGAGPSILVENENGDRERVAATSVEVAALRADHLGDAKKLLWLKLDIARNALTDAWNAAERATRHLHAEPPPEPPEAEVWCTNCERHGINEPRGNPKEFGKGTTLCSFCARYQSANEGRLPSKRLCERRTEGARMTAAAVAEIEAADRRDQRERQQSKRRKGKGRRR